MDVTDNTNNKQAHGFDNPMRQRLLSLKEAALYLGRKPDSMREMIYGHVFKVIQVGERSKMWLDREDLDKWIQDNKRYA